MDEKTGYLGYRKKKELKRKQTGYLNYKNEKMGMEKIKKQVTKAIKMKKRKTLTNTKEKKKKKKRKYMFGRGNESSSEKINKIRQLR